MPIQIEWFWAICAQVFSHEHQIHEMKWMGYGKFGNSWFDVSESKKCAFLMPFWWIIYLSRSRSSDSNNNWFEANKSKIEEENKMFAFLFIINILAEAFHFKSKLIHFIFNGSYRSRSHSYFIAIYRKSFHKKDLVYSSVEFLNKGKKSSKSQHEHMEISLQCFERTVFFHFVYMNFVHKWRIMKTLYWIALPSCACMVQKKNCNLFEINWSMKKSEKRFFRMPFWRHHH